MENKNTRKLEFDVAVCLGRGDGGDVCVSVDVTDEEFELLKECCRNDGDLYDYEGLSELLKTIEAEARIENESCMNDFESEDEDNEEIDYSCVSYTIYIPSAVSNAVEEENTDDEEDE